jgi:hypothetical protein
MSWDLSTICDAVASAVQTTTGIRATGYAPDQPVPACHFVQVLTIEPSTITSAHTEITVRVTTIVARQSDRTGHQALYALMSHNSAGSVRDALWPTTSGDYLGVAGLGFVSLTTQTPGAISLGDAEFLAVEHTLTMIVRRT